MLQPDPKVHKKPPIVVDVVLLGALRCQHEGLHKRAPGVNAVQEWGRCSFSSIASAVTVIHAPPPRVCLSQCCAHDTRQVLENE